jgi:hypothetical protein
MTDPSYLAQWLQFLLQLVQSVSLITILVLFSIQLRQTIRTRRKELFVNYEVLEDALVFAAIYILQFTPPDKVDDFEYEMSAFLRERKHVEGRKNLL